jgi:hypothetical protein
MKEAFCLEKEKIMIRKFCDICGKEEEFKVPLVKTQVYTECTPDGRGNKRVEMDICDMCNHTILQAGLPEKIVSEVNTYKSITKSEEVNIPDNDSCIEYDTQEYGIGYAILKWCNVHNKYFNTKILDSCIKEYEVKTLASGETFGETVLRLYKKMLNLHQYRGLTFKGVELLTK